MKPLSKELRNKFERTIENAREIAEEAARIALEQLGVGEASPYSYLSEDERALRRRLRAHGRNLGDVRDPKTETQEIDRLVEEIAYEHWHRMLFARFLAENDLLMYFEDDDIENAVPVTLSECDELAQELGMKNGWEVAAKFATKMLPQVFRADSPVFEVELPPEKQRQLENIVSNIEGDVFKASDSLGWAYQFWQNKRKASINESGVKIGEDELPAVTQLFTEDYMVDFLIDNSLGAWWANKKLDDNILKKTKTESELKNYIRLENQEFSFLRFIKDDLGKWKTLNDEAFLSISKISEIKLLDPCCGSGHILVSAFQRLVPIRISIEELSAAEACELVIKENIYGLEIDKRCVEIAVFALALAAWTFPGSGGFRELPTFNIAWCGQSINMKKKDWLAFSGNNNDLKPYLETLYSLFENASTLGTLIDPMNTFTENSLFVKDLENALKLICEKVNKLNQEQSIEVMANGIEKAFNLLIDKYNLIITNFPYLGRGKQNHILMNFLENNFPHSKNDLATAFLERSMKLCSKNGTINVVMPQNWLFLSSYSKLRKKLLEDINWNYVVWIGEGGFDSSSAAGAFTALVSLTNRSKGHDDFYTLDISEDKSYDLKSINLLKNNFKRLSQDKQLSNPLCRIINDNEYDSTELLGCYCDSYQGLVTGDLNRFVIKFWERLTIDEDWVKIRGSVDSGEEFGGMQEILLWENGIGSLHNHARINRAQLHDMHESGNLAWNNYGVSINRMRNLRSSQYFGEHFHNNLAVLIPHKPEYNDALFVFCKSGELEREVRKIDRKVSLTNKTLLQIPFSLDKWIEVAQKEYPEGLPRAYSDDPTQWIFHGHPRKSVGPLQVAVARLLGYRWPAELDDEMELSDEARELIAQSQSLLPYADKNGIVCIPSVRGEAPASERLLNLLAAAYKGEDINMILPELLSNADHAGKSLESWLRDKFFTQHNKLFGHRPFIWQIWDGLKDGFSVLVNYHKLDRKNLETLIYTYLGDWISKQKSAMMDGIEGAEEKLNAAISLKKKLELILEGEAPYDIFVRWKPLNKQPLGWEPDLNDGVRVNIRPFMLVGDVGKKGAGVLRDKPNIKWNKDRGKDTENSPWYHLFGGDRINDHHLTLEEKKKAREDEVKFR